MPLARSRYNAAIVISTAWIADTPTRRGRAPEKATLPPHFDREFSPPPGSCLLRHTIAHEALHDFRGRRPDLNVEAVGESVEEVRTFA